MYHPNAQPGYAWGYAPNAPAVILQPPGMPAVTPGMPHPVHHSQSYTYGVRPGVIPSPTESYMDPVIPSRDSYAAPPPVIPPRDSYVVPYQHDYQSPQPDDLNPALDSEARHYAFDLRLQPTEAMHRQLQSRQWAQAPPSMLHQKDPQFVSFVSRSFPWRINLHRSARVGHMPLSVLDVWNVLWTELHQPLTDSDWGFIRMLGSSKWHEVEKAAAARRRLEGKPREGGRIRRVDLLGNKCIFIGLERDNAFAERRVLPGESSRPETWIVKLGSTM